MCVRVEIQPAVVRVQHRHRARSATQLLVVLAEGVHRRPSTADDEFVQLALVMPSQLAELCGQGEREHEILARHQLLQLLVDPALRLEGLALRAVPVAAGMRHPDFPLAAVAGQLHPGRGGAPAQLERAQRFALARQQFVPVLFEQGGRVLGHDVGEAHHTILFQSTLIWPIKLLMYASADCLRCSVRWV